MNRLAPLRALAEHLETLPDRDAHLDCCLSGLRSFLAGEADLDEALGIRTHGSQGRSARTAAALDHRNRLLREIADEFLPDLSRRAQAEELHRRWTRYHASGWRTERTLDQPPPWRAGTIEGRLWEVLRVWDEVLSVERLRRVWVASTPLLVTHEVTDLPDK